MRMIATLLAVLVSCHAPAILGGATQDTTTVLCIDGTRCPLAYPNCPAPNSGGKCEAADGQPLTLRICLDVDHQVQIDGGAWSIPTVPCSP